MPGEMCLARRRRVPLDLVTGMVHSEQVDGSSGGMVQRGLLSDEAMWRRAEAAYSMSDLLMCWGAPRLPMPKQRREVGSSQELSRFVK